MEMLVLVEVQSEDGGQGIMHASGGWKRGSRRVLVTKIL